MIRLGLRAMKWAVSVRLEENKFRSLAWGTTNGQIWVEGAGEGRSCQI